MSCYGGVVGIKVPKLVFGHSSGMIVRKVQQFFDKDNLVKVSGLVNIFFTADLTVMLLISEKEPLIGADWVPAATLPPFAVASNLKSM